MTCVLLGGFRVVETGLLVLAFFEDAASVLTTAGLGVSLSLIWKKRTSASGDADGMGMTGISRPFAMLIIDSWTGLWSPEIMLNSAAIESAVRKALLSRLPYGDAGGGVVV